MVDDELLEVALAVRHEPDLEVVTPQLLDHRQRVLVEREVLVPLPLTHHVGRALARPVRVAAHAADDLLRERDPHLVVVHELALAAQPLDRRDPRVRVAVGVERQPMPLAEAAVPLRAELRPRPEEREIDVEQHGSEHADSRIDGVPRGNGRGEVGGTGVPPHPIGVPRFELGTSPTRTERATRLRHTPSAERVAARRVRRALRAAARRGYAQGDDGRFPGTHRLSCVPERRSQPDPRVSAGGLFCCLKTSH